MQTNIKPKTRQEIADEYQVNRKTLRRWLKNENIILDKGLVKPKDLKLIYLTFGTPMCDGNNEEVEKLF